MGSSVSFTFKARSSRSYFLRVQEEIFEALAVAFDRTIRIGEQTAKKYAPVRKVTRRGGHVTTAELDDAEIAALPESVRKALNPATGAFIRTGLRPRKVTRRSQSGRLNPGISRDVKLNKDTGAFELRNPAQGRYLNSQGRYALSTGVGIDVAGVSVVERQHHRNPRTGKMETFERVRHGVKATLGGRLRREIQGEFYGEQGGIIRGELVSPTEYARYVEFPTSRTAAQPYMRPARDAMETALEKEVRSALMRITG